MRDKIGVVELDSLKGAYRLKAKISEEQKEYGRLSVKISEEQKKTKK